MNERIVVYSAVLVVAAVFLLIATAPESTVSAVVRHGPEVADEEAETLPVETGRPKEELKNSTPVRIHWRLKLGAREWLKDGDFVFRDKQSFAAYLGVGNERFLKWNNLNFKNQMAIVTTQSYSTGGFEESITDVRKVDDELVVFVLRSGPPVGSMVTMACTQSRSGVAVNKSDLPVRFSFYSIVNSNGATEQTTRPER
jgi:hypothetical protein